MTQLIQYFDRHEFSTRVMTALIYAITSAVALNFFWTPAHVYSSGFTGLAQVLNTLGTRFLHVTIPVGLLLVLLNIPLLVMAYRELSKRFAMFTAFALFAAATAMRLIMGPAEPVSQDPLLLALFGGVVNGFGTGLALRNGISTGGLDIIGIFVRRRTGMRMGAVNLLFNFFILLAAGALFGVQFALYTIITLVVNAYMIDAVYTRQQQLQVMIVTEKPDHVIAFLQKELGRGITVVHGAEGAFSHHPKEVLFTVISAYERYDFRDALARADEKAWASTWRIERILGRFHDTKL